MAEFFGTPKAECEDCGAFLVGDDARTWAEKHGSYFGHRVALTIRHIIQFRAGSRTVADSDGDDGA